MDNGCPSLAVNKVIVLICVDDGQKIVGQSVYFTRVKTSNFAVSLLQHGLWFAPNMSPG